MPLSFTSSQNGSRLFTPVKPHAAQSWTSSPLSIVQRPTEPSFIGPYLSGWPTQGLRALGAHPTQVSFFLQGGARRIGQGRLRSRPGDLDFYRLGNHQSVFQFDAEVSNCAVHLGMNAVKATIAHR